MATMDQCMVIVWVESAAHRFLGCRHEYGRQFRTQHKPEGSQTVADDVPEHRSVSPPKARQAPIRGSRQVCCTITARLRSYIQSINYALL